MSPIETVFDVSSSSLQVINNKIMMTITIQVSGLSLLCLLLNHTH